MPEIPAGRQVINAYGGGGFRVAEKRHLGSILVFPDRTEQWNETSAAALTLESLDAILAAQPAVEILLLGCGSDFLDEPPGLRKNLRGHGIVLEWMTTGAACGTFNILIAEERRVAAALIAVD